MTGTAYCSGLGLLGPDVPLLPLAHPVAPLDRGTRCSAGAQAPPALGGGRGKALSLSGAYLAALAVTSMDTACWGRWDGQRPDGCPFWGAVRPEAHAPSRGAAGTALGWSESASDCRELAVRALRYRGRAHRRVCLSAAAFLPSNLTPTRCSCRVWSCSPTWPPGTPPLATLSPAHGRAFSGDVLQVESYIFCARFLSPSVTPSGSGHRVAGARALFLLAE